MKITYFMIISIFFKSSLTLEKQKQFPDFPWTLYKSRFFLTFQMDGNPVL